MPSIMSLFRPFFKANLVSLYKDKVLYQYCSSCLCRSVTTYVVVLQQSFERAGARQGVGISSERPRMEKRTTTDARPSVCSCVHVCALSAVNLPLSLFSPHVVRLTDSLGLTPSMVYNGHAISDTYSPSYRLYKRGCVNHIRDL